MYKATDIDTDKALEAIEHFRRSQSFEYQKELYGMQKYYDVLEKRYEISRKSF